MKSKNEKAPAAELQAMRQYLRDAGMSNQDAQALVKSRTRAENATAITEDLRNRKKAGDR